MTSEQSSVEHPSVETGNQQALPTDITDKIFAEMIPGPLPSLSHAFNTQIENSETYWQGKVIQQLVQKKFLTEPSALTFKQLFHILKPIRQPGISLDILPAPHNQVILSFHGSSFIHQMAMHLKRTRLRFDLFAEAIRKKEKAGMQYDGTVITFENDELVVKFSSVTHDGIRNTTIWMPLQNVDLDVFDKAHLALYNFK